MQQLPTHAGTLCMVTCMHGTTSPGTVCYQRPDHRITACACNNLHDLTVYP